MLLQLLSNSLSLWGHYALLAVAFYLASVGSRHFNFATGLAFLASPYIVLSVQNFAGIWLAFSLSLFCAAILGYLYYEGSVAAYRSGSRSGQLLLISLAVLGISENVVSVIFGPGSQKLFAVGTGQEWSGTNHILLLIGFCLVVGVDILWRRSLFGLSLQALNESRLNLRLRGFNVGAIERLTSILGFFLGGIAGLLWSMDLRIRPTMGFEVCLIGVVAFIVGPMLADGPRGLIGASLGIVLIRLPLLIFFEGDWEMASSLLLLAFASAARLVRSLTKNRRKI